MPQAPARPSGIWNACCAPRLHGTTPDGQGNPDGLPTALRPCTAGATDVAGHRDRARAAELDLRGGLLRRFADDVAAASWDSAIVDVGDEMVKLSLSDVSGLGAGTVGKLLEESPDMASLVAGLRERGLAGLSK